MTTLQLGIVLKEMVRVRPSLLGTAVILMELCAVGPLGSSQPFQEVLPLPLPDDTEAEIEVRRVLEKVRLGQPEAGSKESLDNWVPVAGVDAWVWLQVVLLNYMYIGKDRLLTQTLFHSKTLLECQVPVMEKLKWNARTFGNSGESVRIGPWHDVSEQLWTDDCPRRGGVAVLCRGPEALLPHLSSWLCLAWVLHLEPKGISRGIWAIRTTAETSSLYPKWGMYARIFSHWIATARAEL